MSDIGMLLLAAAPSVIAIIFGIHAYRMDCDEVWHSEPIYHRYQQSKE